MGSGLEFRIVDKEFDSYVDKIKSKHITIILESCYSGKILTLPKMKNVVFSSKAKETGIYLIKYSTGLIKKLDFLSILER